MNTATTQANLEQAADLEVELQQFTGSEQFRRWSVLFPRDILTDGAHYLAQKASAFWLMDLIASWQHKPQLRAEAFQTWTLTRTGDNWLAVCDDGNGNVITRQRIEYSDFPLPTFKLFAVRNERRGITIMLPSEY
jgi:hypothetical protein